MRDNLEEILDILKETRGVLAGLRDKPWSWCEADTKLLAKIDALVYPKKEGGGK